MVLAGVLSVVSIFARLGVESLRISAVALGAALAMLVFVVRGARERNSQKSLVRIAFLGSLVVFVAATNTGGFEGTTAFWLVCLPLITLDFTDFRYVIGTVAGGLSVLVALVLLQLLDPGLFAAYDVELQHRAAYFDHFGVFATASVLVITAYRSRQKLHDQISNQNVLLSRLLQILGHDLVNSLAVIQMNQRRLASRLSQRVEGPEDAALLKSVETMGRHLSLLEGLVRKSKLLARWQSGVLLETERVHLLEALTLSLQLCQEQADRKGLRVLYSSEDCNVWVRSDLTLLVHEGLQNFLGNAIKFSSSAAAIGVHVLRREHHVEMAIDDVGPGIPAEVLRGLTSEDPIRSAMGTGGEQGSGFGLRIAQDMLRAVGAEVFVVNKAQGLPPELAWVAGAVEDPQRGTVVVLRLPLWVE